MSGDPLVEELVLRLKQRETAIGHALTLGREMQEGHVSARRPRWRCAEVVEDPQTGSNAGGAIGGRTLQERKPISEVVDRRGRGRAHVVERLEETAREPRHLGRVEDTPDVRDK